MPEEETPEGQGAKKTPGEQVPITPAAEPSEEGDRTIPYARFQEVNERMKKAEGDLKALKADQDKVRQEELKEQGKYKELLDERDKELAIARKENEAFHEDQDKRREAILSKLPDEEKKFAETHLKALSALEEYSEKFLQNTADLEGDRPTAPTGEFQKPDKPFYEWTEDEKQAWVQEQIKKAAGK